MKIIAGLGNPGEKYENTRHNIGFMMIDEFAKQQSLSWREEKKFKALVCRFEDNILVKPLTFMNESGQAIQNIMNYYNLLPKKMGFLKEKDCDLSNILTVIHDELDIDFGKFKISTNRGPAGHNGIKSIINQLKTKNFKRLRIGIKNKDLEVIPVLGFVLQRFKKEELVFIKKDLTKEVIKNIQFSI